MSEYPDYWLRQVTQVLIGEASGHSGEGNRVGSVKSKTKDLYCEGLSTFIMGVIHRWSRVEAEFGGKLRRQSGFMQIWLYHMIDNSITPKKARVVTYVCMYISGFDDMACPVRYWFLSTLHSWGECDLLLFYGCFGNPYRWLFGITLFPNDLFYPYRRSGEF